MTVLWEPNRDQRGRRGAQPRRGRGAPVVDNVTDAAGVGRLQRGRAGRRDRRGRAVHRGRGLRRPHAHDLPGRGARPRAPPGRERRRRTRRSRPASSRSSAVATDAARSAAGARSCDEQTVPEPTGPTPDRRAGTRARGRRDHRRVLGRRAAPARPSVSTNLALALNRCGSAPCLVDLDLEFGDVAVCLQLAPARNIADAASLDLSDDAVDRRAGHHARVAARLRARADQPRRRRTRAGRAWWRSCSRSCARATTTSSSTRRRSSPSTCSKPSTRHSTTCSSRLRRSRR